jgi:hypothetical protein
MYNATAKINTSSSTQWYSSKGTLRPSIIFPPPSILNNNPFPLHQSPRKPRICLISHTPTPSPLHPLLLHPRRLHIPICLIFFLRRHRRHSLSYPLPLNILLHLALRAPPPTLPFVRHTNSTCARTVTPRFLYAHQLDSCRWWAGGSYGSRRRCSADYGFRYTATRGSCHVGNFGLSGRSGKFDIFFPFWASCDCQ